MSHRSSHRQEVFRNFLSGVSLFGTDDDDLVIENGITTRKAFHQRKYDEIRQSTN